MERTTKKRKADAVDDSDATAPPTARRKRKKLSKADRLHLFEKARLSVQQAETPRKKTPAKASYAKGKGEEVQAIPKSITLGRSRKSETMEKVKEWAAEEKAKSPHGKGVSVTTTTIGSGISSYTAQPPPHKENETYIFLKMKENRENHRKETSIRQNLQNEMSNDNIDYSTPQQIEQVSAQPSPLLSSKNSQPIQEPSFESPMPLPSFESPMPLPSFESPMPLPSLKRHVSQDLVNQIVMANTIADMENKPLPYTADPKIPDIPDEAEAAKTYDNMSVASASSTTSQSSNSPPKCSPAFCWMLTTVLTFWCTIVFVLFNQYFTTFLITTVKIPIEQFCFQDNLASKNNSATVDIVPCESATPSIPCPDYGLCQHGKLIKCDSVNHKIAESKDMCVNTHQFNATKDSVVTLLERWTASSLCGLDECPRVNYHADNMPLFELSTVFGELGMGWDIDVVDDKNIFALREEKHQLLVLGLTPHHKIDFPFFCWCMRTSSEIIDISWEFIKAELNIILTASWQFILKHPLGSLLGLMFTFILRYMQMRRKKREMVLLAVAQIRKIVIKKLEEGGYQEHVVIHVRDAIVWDVHPTKKSKRNYLIHEVWPRVVFDLKHDNRIRKGVRAVEGKPRDVWQWIANKSSSQ